MAKNMARMIDDDKLDTRLLLQTLTAVKKGDFSVRLPTGWAGIDGKIADTLERHHRNDVGQHQRDRTGEPRRRQRRKTFATRRASALRADRGKAGSMRSMT